MEPQVFRDRHDAGRQLAVALERFRADRPVVVGLPRGGVPVAAEVARALDAPLDVLIVRKVGAPSQPEFAIGAMGEGVVKLDQALIRRLGISFDDVHAVVARERLELDRRIRVYRAVRDPVDVTGRTVIVVDDGLATGLTARAAIEVLRRRRPSRVVFAAPVCAPDSAQRLADVADEVACLRQPGDFRAVGLWYRDFSPTSDAEVVALLEEASVATGSRAPR
jgi:putative phosphoribosyl transferase